MNEKIAAEVERLMVAPKASGGGSPSAGTSRGKSARTPSRPDAASLRNALRTLLREPDGSQSLWVERAVRDKISGLFENQAEKRLNAGDAAGALLALEPLTDLFVERWTNLAENDEIYGIFPYLGGLWERVLAASVGTMTPAVRQGWKTKLAGWAKILDSGYDVEKTFDAAIKVLL